MRYFIHATSLLCTVSCISTVTVALWLLRWLYSSDMPTRGMGPSASYEWNMCSRITFTYDQSVNFMPKIVSRFRITNFLIPDARIGNFLATLNHEVWLSVCLYLYAGWPKKTGPVWALITQRWLVVERRVIRQKFQNAVKNKRQICIVKHLNILCPIYINICHPRNSAKLTGTLRFNKDIWAFII